MNGEYIEEMAKKYSSTIKEKIQRNEDIAQEFEQAGGSHPEVDLQKHRLLLLKGGRT